MEILIKKTIFSPEFLPGQIIKIQEEDVTYNGLLIANNEKELQVGIIQEVYGNDGERTNEFTKLNISVDDIENGAIIIQTNDENRLLQVQRNAYHAYRELSSMLCSEEHISADGKGLLDQSDIDERHETRMQEFVKILKS